MNVELLEARAVREPLGVVESYRVDASRRLDEKKKSELGQFLTPATIAAFMASLFSDPTQDEVHVLDAGAGVGSLTAALVERFCGHGQRLERIRATFYEIDPILIEYLETTANDCRIACRQTGVEFEADVLEEDFIGDAVRCLSGDIPHACGERRGYTHAILNPPYKKIRNDSDYRRLLRSVDIEASNLYTGFVALTILLLREGGELVAIVPRSFCNGPYFKPFRQLLLSKMSLRQIHVFESRKTAFKDDGVLQENIVLHAVKGGAVRPVLITSSSGADFHDITCIEREFDQVVSKDDPNQFLHIATNDLDQHVIDRMAVFTHPLESLELSVSTGPVVDFRLKEYLRDKPGKGTVPLIYPGHFKDNFVTWPNGEGRKPNAILRNAATEKWLFPRGTYTIVRRFSSKEERRRIVAAIYNPDKIDGEAIGFENHLNVFHTNKEGLPRQIAMGLAVYLNSTLVDVYFRQFSGHTQVNATDLRTLRYPTLEDLTELGYGIEEGGFPDQQTIDQRLEKIIQRMANIPSSDPVEAQHKIQGNYSGTTAGIGSPLKTRSKT